MTVSKDDLIDFVYDEVRMLDEGRYDDWMALWTADGMYWMPLDWKQADPIHETSLMWEDQFMLRLRIERLKGARTFSQKPKSRCHHVIQRPYVDLIDDEAGKYVVTTQMHYVETRLDDQFLLAVTARHDLVLQDGALKIAQKRVDILNCDAAFGNIQLLP
ncbi:aromatic-ring-hydroxylating dioxygenase subunit beta [Chachezhania sediminis]|uniref:aromatic-ring-hydroxylating dioxygenase subunit beta n=1 Tax=Chachezhania sediminis TaxID=2599291 RepID=UPI00131BC52B|nr:aromatic-ring-hydroxylating dioxygenase subunit beta [Chachezhania sediminis]